MEGVKTVMTIGAEQYEIDLDALDTEALVCAVVDVKAWLARYSASAAEFRLAQVTVEEPAPLVSPLFRGDVVFVPHRPEAHLTLLLAGEP